MGLGRCGRMVALGGALLLFLVGCDRGNAVSIITATPVCPVAANAASVNGTVTAFDTQSLTVTTATNTSVVVQYFAPTRFERLAPLSGNLKVGTLVQVLVQATGSGVPAALTVIQQPMDNPQTTCTASQGGVPGVVGTVAAVSDDGSQFTLTDADGKQYLLAITATTSLTELNAATASDISVGERVLVTGTTRKGGIDARQIIITTNAI